MTPVAEPRCSIWITAIFTLAVFAGYLATLAPGLTGGDSGELIYAAANLGVAHPPGYPLWTLLGHVFSWLPVGTVAWRLNLFAAISAAAAAGLLCRVIQLWTRQDWAGVCGSGLFAFSPLAWEYARQAEVFGFNNLLLALVLFTATRLALRVSTAGVFWCALGSGLAMAHHQTAVFLVGPMAVWVGARLLTAPEGRGRRLVAAAAGALLGLSPYLYLPLATHFSRAWHWGECDSWNGLLIHVLRREYGTFQLASGSAASTHSLGLVLRQYFADTVPAMIYVGLPLAILGVAKLFRRGGRERWRGLAWAVVVALAAYWFGFFALVNLPPGDPLLGGVLARFWMLPDMLLALFAGLGFAALTSALKPTPWRSPAMAMGLVVSAGVLHFRNLPDSSDLVAAYGRAILEPLPGQAVLLVRGDLPSNAIRQVQSAEKFRPDVTVLDLELLSRSWYVRQARIHFPDLVFPGEVYLPGAANGFSFASLVNANGSAHSVWLYPEPKPGDPTVAEFAFWPCGLAQQILPGSAAAPDGADWAQANRKELSKLRAQFAPAIRFAPGTWERVVAEDYWSAEHRHAYTLLQIALAAQNSEPLLRQARDAYEQFLADCPINAWYAWKNLGLIYDRLAATEPDARLKQASAWQKYLALAPAEDPDRDAITEFLRRSR